MDVCCFNRPFDDQAHEKIRIESEAVLAILNRCLNDWKLIGSEVIDYELSKIPEDERRMGAKILAKISRKNIIIDHSIKRRASEMERFGLKAVDALYVACAEGSDDVMLTTDDEIVRKVKANRKHIKIRVENPLNWLMEVIKDGS